MRAPHPTGGRSPTPATEETQATEEEQRALEAIVERALAHTSDEGATQQLLKAVRDAPDPVRAVGMMAAQYVAKVDQELDVPEGILMEATGEVTEMIAEVVDAAGVVPFANDDETLQAAGRYAVAALADIYENTPEDMQAALGDEGMAMMEGARPPPQQPPMGGPPPPGGAPPPQQGMM